MYRKLLFKALRQSGRWAYSLQVWWEKNILHYLDCWTDYFDDHE